MSNANVVTSQPAPSAPPSDIINMEKPNENVTTPPLLNGVNPGLKTPIVALQEDVVVTQPLLNSKEDLIYPNMHDNIILAQPLLNEKDMKTPSTPEETVVLTQPMLNNENMEEMLAEAKVRGAEKERRRQRELDFCCFSCANSYSDNDAFCWYFFCRWLCECCGNCCEGIAQCTDSCCEGCAECCNNCCEGQEGCDSCCGDGCCGDGGDGCCDGGDASGDCDCGDCDCDCGDCDCSCLN